MQVKGLTGFFYTELKLLTYRLLVNDKIKTSLFRAIANSY